jgi:hypothetical protein
MSIINKVTTLRLSQSASDEDIQTHLEEHNGDGWYLVGLDNLVGWYRFFWAKVIE